MCMGRGFSDHGTMDVLEAADSSAQSVACYGFQ